MTYNLPSTVKELYKAKEYLLGKGNEKCIVALLLCCLRCFVVWGGYDCIIMDAERLATHAALICVPLRAAFVVFFFSGLWPHAKLLAILFMWFRPESERERGKWQGTFLSRGWREQRGGRAGFDKCLHHTISFPLTLGHPWGNAPGAYANRVALAACTQAYNEGRGDLAREGGDEDVK
jgi:hypothetical protein